MTKWSCNESIIQAVCLQCRILSVKGKQREKMMTQSKPQHAPFLSGIMKEALQS